MRERQNLMKCKKGFTLAEVLITLGIIGVISAITIPSLLNHFQEEQYKNSYKKAFSNLYQAFNSAKHQDLFVDVSQAYTGANTGGNNLNLAAIMNQFKVIKKCINVNVSSCWDPSGEKYGKIYDSSGRPMVINNAFIDSSGMAWVAIEPYQGRIAVDTNGFKKPNQYGKDRFVFWLLDDFNNQYAGVPTKLKPYDDNNTHTCYENACGTVGNKDYNKYYGTSWLSK